MKKLLTAITSIAFALLSMSALAITAKTGTINVNQINQHPIRTHLIFCLIFIVYIKNIKLIIIINTVHGVQLFNVQKICSFP